MNPPRSTTTGHFPTIRTAMTLSALRFGCEFCQRSTSARSSLFGLCFVALLVSGQDARLRAVFPVSFLLLLTCLSECGTLFGRDVRPNVFTFACHGLCLRFALILGRSSLRVEFHGARSRKINKLVFRCSLVKLRGLPRRGGRCVLARAMSLSLHTPCGRVYLAVAQYAAPIAP